MDSDSNFYYGCCVVGKCAKLCAGFSPQATQDKHCASCSCMKEFHQRVSAGSESDNGDEEDSNPEAGESEGESDDSEMEGKGKGKATDKKRKVTQKKLSPHPSRPQHSKSRLQLASSKFTGKLTARSTSAGSGGSSSKHFKKATISSTSTVKMEGRKKSQISKQATQTVARKTSGPTPSLIRELGNLFLVCDAIQHQLEQDHCLLSEGMVLMTRSQFNRGRLSALGLKLGKASKMQLNENWTVSELHQFIVSCYPQVFAWVMENLPAGHRVYPWILLVAEGHELHQSLRSEASLDMNFIWDVVYKNGTAYSKSELFIGTAIPVPTEVIKNLVVFPETHLHTHDAGSDSEITETTILKPGLPSGSHVCRTSKRLCGRPPSIALKDESPPRKRKRSEPKTLKEEGPEDLDVKVKFEPKLERRSPSIEEVACKRIKKETEVIDLTDETTESAESAVLDKVPQAQIDLSRPTTPFD
ncbi:hypothetical protein BDV93DRAFT_562816 [Ceratobasidium sp. AG-I]|nr:hypothetical protein BDV93DRAFT_562816 [Ceratobasidium sp. AG-I]